ncbi:cathepsin G-like [Alligator sinensis]|uniref:Cathepsin G-like n=1 Tax=Alligator sinensis TaxID=38654 RepID=A0A3Q0FVY5_ALLSI|nr:cathepsin G-like [Alligator sinensis]
MALSFTGSSWRDLNKISVVLGAHNVRKPEANSQKIDVRHQIVHPKYRRKTKHNDIMLLQLIQKAKLNDQGQLIGLPAKGEAVQPGTVCRVSGWEGRSLWNWKSLNVLLEVDLPVRRDRVCEKAFYTYAARVQMCAGDSSSKKSAFRVDSEGALVCNGTAHGILSYGPRRRTFPQVFAKVSSFIPWIESELKKLKP